MYVIHTYYSVFLAILELHNYRLHVYRQITSRYIVCFVHPLIIRATLIPVTADNISKEYFFAIGTICTYTSMYVILYL